MVISNSHIYTAPSSSSSWATTDLKSQGRLSIDSNGYKNMKITAGLGGSKLEAQGGIVGGKIQLRNLSSYGECSAVVCSQSNVVWW